MRELRERTDGIRTKAAIRQEALRLFLRNGLRETTLDDIAQAAAVSLAYLLFRRSVFDRGRQRVSTLGPFT